MRHNDSCQKRGNCRSQFERIWGCSSPNSLPPHEIPISTFSLRMKIETFPWGLCPLCFLTLVLTLQECHSAPVKASSKSQSFRPHVLTCPHLHSTSLFTRFLNMHIPICSPKIVLFDGVYVS